MARQMRHQLVPASGPERERLRERGQFWTPDWVAEAMVAYVLAGDSSHIFDPAVGAGAFFRAAKVVSSQLQRPVALLGTEVDQLALVEALDAGLTREDISLVRIQDFVLGPPSRRYKAIVANPPYIRHHRLSSVVKAQLKALSEAVVGTSLDGRAGLHVYFLMRALQLLEADGRLAFIVPADTCEGKFAPALWNWIARTYRLDAVVTFTPDATPFPNVDTNAVILMIRNAAPASKLVWAQCVQSGTDDLKTWIRSGFAEARATALVVHRRQLSEALATGLSRPPVRRESNQSAILADFATVMRGIATGSNEFFFLTAACAHEVGIPDAFLRLSIGRTRDVDGDEITHATLRALEAKGRPTRLLALDGRPAEYFPAAVREYLERGEAMRLPTRALIAQRKPWYKMETRPVPPFLFAYLGRRNTRFIRNSAGVVPLTGFLCVYPRSNDPEFIERLWQVLRHPQTVANLSLVGKSYGSGAIKVEPRALERLPIPSMVLREAQIGVPDRFEQPTLF